jgi:hypothetical protein
MDNPGPPALPTPSRMLGPTSAGRATCGVPPVGAGTRPSRRPNPATQTAQLWTPSNVTAAAQSPRRRAGRARCSSVASARPPAERNSKGVRTVARYGGREDLISWGLRQSK